MWPPAVPQCKQREASPEGLASRLLLQLVGHEGQQRDLTGALDGLSELTLVHGAGAGGPAGQDLGTLRDKAAQLGGVFVIDILAFVRAELADLAALAAGWRGSRAELARFVGVSERTLYRKLRAANGRKKES